MIKIIKEIDIEVTKPNIFQAIVAKQYDMNTRFLKATLKDCGTRIDVPKIETTKVVINAERKDGKSKSFDGEINEDGTVTVPLHSWMLELDGTVNCDISVIDTAIDDGKKLTTTSFTLLVEKAAYGGEDITSDPQYDVLVQLLETCASAGAVYDACVEATEKANIATQNAEAAIENANEAAEEANKVRKEVEAGGYIESLKELNNGDKFSFWVGTQEEYDALETIKNNCFYIITDNTKDYVIEQGTSDVWTYRKWNSGIVECWADIRNIPSEPTGTKSHEFITAYPFTITNGVLSVIPVKFGWAHTQCMYIEKNNSSCKIRYYFDTTGTANGTPLTQCEFSFDVVVKGKWK